MINFKDKNEQYDFIYKIVLVGDPYVGKTNILSRFLNEIFIENSKATIGVDFGVTVIDVNNKKIKTQIWDTPGQERYKPIASAYYIMADGVIIVFDIANKSSFERIESWINEIKLHIPLANILIVGNKSDLQCFREIDYDDIKSFCSNHGYSYVETSAKNNINVNYALTLLVEEIINKPIKELSIKQIDITQNTDSPNQSLSEIKLLDCVSPETKQIDCDINTFTSLNENNIILDYQFIDNQSNSGCGC